MLPRLTSPRADGMEVWFGDIIFGLHSWKWTFSAEFEFGPPPTLPGCSVRGSPQGIDGAVGSPKLVA